MRGEVRWLHNLLGLLASSSICETAHLDPLRIVEIQPLTTIAYNRSATSISARPVSSWATAPGNCTQRYPIPPPSPQTDTGCCRYLLEHGLKADGRPDPDAKDVAEGGSYETFFTETGNGKYVPRSIFVDLDPSVRGPIPCRAGQH